MEEYNGGPVLVADGSSFIPKGKVVLPFTFVGFRSTQMWNIDFIVFADDLPYDICLGRRFISLSGLLKPPSGALPVGFRKIKPNFYRSRMAGWIMMEATRFLVFGTAR
jgi:hypothetical protein